MNNSIKKTRVLLTIALILNIMSWFIPDMFFPNSHFTSTEWPLHARYHVGATATVNFVFILMGLWMIWKPKFDLAVTMRWVTTWLATWNIVFILFGMLVIPFILGPGDHHIDWNFDPEGAGNVSNIGVEGAVFPIVGTPTLLFLWVLWRLSKR